MIVDILVLDEGSLTANLGRNFVVRKTSSGEEGNLLTTGNGVHDIDGGDTSLDHLLRILSLIGVNGLTLKIYNKSFAQKYNLILCGRHSNAPA